MNNIRNAAPRSFAARFAGPAVAAALFLGAPALATIAAAPASADNGINIQGPNGGGLFINDDAVVFGNGRGDGGFITDDRVGIRIGGVAVDFDD